MSGPFGVQPLILVVEGDSNAGRSLVSTLAAHGFRTLRALARAGTVTLGGSLEADLILMDGSHPDVDAVGLTAKLRERTTAPILVLLERSRVAQRAAVLDAGASDYMVSPAAPLDLLARMRVWLRQAARMRHQRPGMEMVSERVSIDRDRRSVFVEGREIHITPLECKLLLTLAGRSLTEEQIVAAVWGTKAAGRSHYLRAHVRQLRQKLERNPSSPRYLVTEAGGGYRLKLG
ncbi:MAG TPA: response regulator transcription factor [Polyangiaceae bacterium]|nr:response regulator transcription factor [Polyangiaceae bacterium]